MNTPPTRTQKDDACDSKVQQTLEIIARLKASDASMKEFVKAAAKYQQQVLATTAAGKVLIDSMLKLAEERGGDLGEAIKNIAECQKLVESKRGKLSQNVLDMLIQPYEKWGQGQIELDKAEIVAFEKNYKNKRSASLRLIKKWEKETNKLNKKKNKDTNKIQAALTTLTESVEQHDQMLGDSLKAAFLIDRKKYCFFIGQWNKVLADEVEGFENAMKLMLDHKPALESIAADGENVSQETYNLIASSKPEKALSQLRNARETGYFTTLDLSGVDDGELDSGTSTIRGRNVPTYKVRVRQRYDAAQDDELSLTIGDIFDVSEEVDENWGVAELNGKRGIFPLNHVEKMISLT
jgi:hypothetical protein